MLFLGNHTTSSKGYENMAKQMLKNGGNTFAFFTRNPRGGKAKALDQEDIARFLKLTEEHSFGRIVAHAPYTMNACAEKENLRIFARETMRDDLQRLESTPGNYYNFHPGSHVGQGMETGISLIAQMLKEILDEAEYSTTILLETMSGKGSEVGGRFEEIRAILDQSGHADQLGVCLDTCHVWDAGYDIREHLDEVLAEFDRVIGLSHLKAIHLNDSLNGLGSHKDRHAKIGEGQIGLEALVQVIRHPMLSDIPFILETPNDDEGWKKEITLLRERYGKEDE